MNMEKTVSCSGSTINGTHQQAALHRLKFGGYSYLSSVALPSSPPVSKFPLHPPGEGGVSAKLNICFHAIGMARQPEDTTNWKGH